jgi:hypothetical protein
MKKFLLLFLTIVITSCATTQVVSNSVASESYRASYDEVWTKVIRFFATNQISIGTLEKDSGIVTLKGDNLNSQLMNEYCEADENNGFLERLLYGNVMGSVNVIDEGGIVTVTVNARYNTFHAYGQNYYPARPCASKGVFERQILDSI